MNHGCIGALLIPFSHWTRILMELKSFSRIRLQHFTIIELISFTCKLPKIQLFQMPPDGISYPKVRSLWSPDLCIVYLLTTESLRVAHQAPAGTLDIGGTQKASLPWWLFHLRQSVLPKIIDRSVPAGGAVGWGISGSLADVLWHLTWCSLLVLPLNPHGPPATSSPWHLQISDSVIKHRHLCLAFNLPTRLSSLKGRTMTHFSS